MQMQTETTKTTDLDAELAAAEAALSKLQSTADEYDVAAERARVTFEREPTQQSHSDAVVLAQRAVNARAAVEKFAGGTVAPIRNAVEERDRDVERAKLRPKLDWSRVEAPMDRIRDAFIELGKALDSGIPEISRVLTEWRELAGPANALGLRTHMSGFDALLARTQSEINAELAGNECFHSIIIGGTGAAVPTVRVEIQRPARIGKHLL